MKTFSGMVVGAGLAVMTASAVADGRYYATEAGYVSDNDGRVYSYAIYGSDEPATPVVTSAADVNADARGAIPTAQLPAPSVEAQTSRTATPDEQVAPLQSTVSVKAADVNEVFGRA